MADGLNRGQKTEDRRPRTCAASPRLCVKATVFCLLSSVFCHLNAEELQDPTRPPAGLAAPAAAQGQLLRSSGLQTTIISRSRRAAIIDGKTVALGEMHGNARLIEVNEGSVVLQSGRTRRVLTLFPDVKMTPSAARARDAQSDGGPHPKENNANPFVQDQRNVPGHPKEDK